MDEVIVTAGLTGSRIGKEQTPHIPVTARRDRGGRDRGVAAGCVRAARPRARPRERAGHAGPRRVRSGGRAAAAETDAVLCLTTSGIPGRNLPVEERLAPLDLRPELASFDAGSINTPAGVFLNPPEFLDALAVRARERGVKLELECFDSGMVATALRYAKRG